MYMLLTRNNRMKYQNRAIKQAAFTTSRIPNRFYTFTVQVHDQLIPKLRRNDSKVTKNQQKKTVGQVRNSFVLTLRGTLKELLGYYGTACTTYYWTEIPNSVLRFKLYDSITILQYCHSRQLYDTQKQQQNRNYTTAVVLVLDHVENPTGVAMLR